MKFGLYIICVWYKLCVRLITGSNNARAERINGAIEELKRIGSGYRNKQNFKAAILFFHGDQMAFHTNPAEPQFKLY